MLNLLPEDMRGFHKKRMLNSASLVWGVGVLLLLVIGLLTLVPAYSYTLVRNKKDTEQIKSEQKTHELAEEMQLQLEDDTKVALYVEGFFKSKKFTNLYDAFYEKVQQHPEVAVEQITFARGDKSNTLTVRGRTETREKLVAFVRDVESSELFHDVSLPIGELAGREDVFQFTLTLQTSL